MAASATSAAIVISVAAVIRAVIGGESSGDRLGQIAQQAVESGSFAWIALITSQLALLACAWLACRMLRTPARDRLGLVATGLSSMQGAVLLVATAVPFALGLLAASFVQGFIEPSSEDSLGLTRMWSEGSRAESVAWILLIAILPGFVEEVFYRGFLQRGLLMRWGPTVSIVICSLLFSLVHGDVVWATALLPLGMWLGVVAWRTNSVVMTFAMHAGINGFWTAAMMVLHRDPSTESLLNGMAIAVLALSVIAFPWAIFILRRCSPLSTASDALRSPPSPPLQRSLLPRVAVATVVAGALIFMIIPPGQAPATPEQQTTTGARTSDELSPESLESVTCTAIGDLGAVEFTLMPGGGARIALPSNRAGIDHVIVALDEGEHTVWLTCAGERTGKGGKRRPLGMVDQLAAGEPTVLCMTLSPGPPPVSVRLTLEDDEASMAAAMERADTEGWAKRGRK